MGVLSRPAPGVSRPDDGFTDYSAELKISRSRPFRWIYASLGMLCVGAGIIGVFLPGWPTTIWLLIAAWLFSRSSPRFYNRILNHRMFGPIVRDYRAGNGVPTRIKLIAILSILVFAGVSTFFLIESQVVRLVVVAIAMFGIGFMFGLPTRKPYAAEQSQSQVAPGAVTNDSVGL